MSEPFANLPNIAALEEQDIAAASGVDPAVAQAEQTAMVEQALGLQPGQVPYDPTDANQALAESLSPEELAAFIGQAPVPAPVAAPVEVAPAAPAPAAPQATVDPVIAALMQQNQALQQYMATAEQRAMESARAFRDELAAFRPKPVEAPKSELEMFQDETANKALARARQEIRDQEVTPLARRLEALENAAKEANIARLAESRMNEAHVAASTVFGETMDKDALPAAQELTLALSYGYEIPMNQAASLAKSLISKAVDSHLRSLNKRAQAAVATRPAQVPVTQSTIAAGGTGGVAGKLPAWFTAE